MPCKPACPASVVQTDMPALALTTPLTRTFSKSRRFPCVLHTKRLRFTQEGSTHTKKAAACAPLRLRLRALSSCSVAWSPPPPACIRALSISRCLLRLHPLRAKPQNFTTSAKRSCNRQASQTSIADQAASSLRARALLMRRHEGDEAFRVAPTRRPDAPTAKFPAILTDYPLPAEASLAWLFAASCWLGDSADLQQFCGSSLPLTPATPATNCA